MAGQWLAVAQALTFRARVVRRAAGGAASFEVLQATETSASSATWAGAGKTKAFGDRGFDIRFGPNSVQ